MKKTKEIVKSDVQLNLVFIKYNKNKKCTYEASDSKPKSKLFNLICSVGKEVVKIIIKLIIEMFTAYISAKLNGLIYKFLILSKNEFFYSKKEKDEYGINFFKFKIISQK